MLYVTWAQDDDPGMLRSVSITFTNLAWKGYRGARSARRSRADQRLEALVRSHLSQFDALNDPSYVGRAAELEISVACVDLFPPPAGPSSASGERLMAG